ncbi:MAG: hypothetical protein ACHQJ5_01485 [Vicinamibacteria bacterium]|jgi:hypothetical protein
MLARLKNALGRLRRSLSNKAEDAYKERDAAEDDSQAEAFASGEAHAYSVAEGEVRDEERKE